jgi:CDP-diacylglycerol--glycerol-3-phosphate 3-phosphatidyltransferase
MGKHNPAGIADVAACLVFAAAAITDTLDGYLARRWGQTTALGAFLDPVADKLIVAVALVMIVSRDQRLAVVLSAVVIIGREIAVSALREWMAELGHRTKVKVSALGKVQDTAYWWCGASVAVSARNCLVCRCISCKWLTEAAALLTLVSMFVYLRAALPYLREQS